MVYHSYDCELYNLLIKSELSYVKLNDIRYLLIKIARVNDNLLKEGYYDDIDNIDETNKYSTDDINGQLYSEYYNFELYVCHIPIEFLILHNVDPRIVKYLFNRWHPEPLNHITTHYYYRIIPDNIHNVLDVARDVLEKKYTCVYYTSKNVDIDVARLDEYAAICGVEYEKKRPYGEWPRVEGGVKDM